MVALNKETLADKLAAILEKRIRQGKYTPGRSMPSTRELAAEFHISQQVSMSAIEILESKGLVLRLNRKGVYVNPELFNPGKLEFSILAPLQHDSIGYVGHMLSTSDARIWGGITLVNYSVPRTDISTPQLRYELDRACRNRPDCLIVHYPKLPKAALGLFSCLEVPTLFIGDFDWIPDADLKLNQIVEDTFERGEAFAKAALACGARSMVCVGSTAEREWWQKSFDDGVMRCAGRRPLEYAYVVSWENGGMTESELSAARRACIRELLKGGVPDVLAFDGCGGGYFMDELNAQGLRVGKDIQVICNKYLIPGTVFIEERAEEFSKSAMDILKRLANERGYACGRQVLQGIKRKAIRLQEVQ